jgi:hypothetical protein
VTRKYRKTLKENREKLSEREVKREKKELRDFMGDGGNRNGAKRQIRDLYELGSFLNGGENENFLFKAMPDTRNRRSRTCSQLFLPGKGAPANLN